MLNYSIDERLNIVKIIDFERRGNLVRFYLGSDDDQDFWGEDWDERPYEVQENNGVYEQHIKGYRDIVFPFDAIVCEPCDGHKYSRRSKRDMKGRRTACIVCMMPSAFDEDEYSWLYVGDFDMCAADGRAVKFYFGDPMEPSDEIVVFEDNLLGRKMM